MSRSARFGALGTLGAALLALTGNVWAGANAQSVTADQAPQAWIVYAQAVSQHLQSALASDAEPAQRFNAFFGHWVATDADVASSSEALSEDAALPADPPTLKVKVWLDRKGQVTRVEFDQVADDLAAADLRALLLAQSIGASPPRRMKQPVVVRLALGAEL
jgi:hypothetical protein